jgi:hypothetical protein
MRLRDKASIERRINDLRTLRIRLADEITTLEARLVAPPKKRSRYDPPPCGTEQGYQWHHYRKQDADEACLAAHALHARAYQTRVRAETGKAPA